jgi:hypothetical protein
VERTVRQIEKHLVTRPDLKIFLIYYNPVRYVCFDVSGMLSRLLAREFDFAESERALAPLSNSHDSVLIYQSTIWMLAPFPDASAQVRIMIPDYGADVVS